MTSNSLTQDFLEKGYFVTQNSFSKKDIKNMQVRIEDIILGKFKKLGRRFQTHTDSLVYDGLPKTKMEYRGPNVVYSKISDLEYDDCFLKILQSKWMSKVLTRFLGDTISILRFGMIVKPPFGGTPIPWHQDTCLDWPTTLPPGLAIWFPLDKATSSSGTLQVIPESHKNGVIGRGHLLPKNMKKKYAPQNKILDVEINSGDCLFFHPALLHRSGINQTKTSRRALNIVLIAGNSIHTGKQLSYPMLKGSEQLEPNKVLELSSVPD
jgi:phytanoyl-CoA hydroxylase